MKKTLTMIVILCLCHLAKAQIFSPIKWSYAAQKINANEAVLIIKATMDAGWHIYSTLQKDGGPKKTTIEFKPSSDYDLIGRISEPKALVRFDGNYGINILSFEKSVIFRQKVRLKKPATLKGNITYMVCTNQRCLSPETIEFSIPVE